MSHHPVVVGGDGLLCLDELFPFISALPKVVTKDRLVWLSTVQTESEAVNNLLLAADPAVLVDHPVPMPTAGITREHFVAMFGPETPSGAGPVDYLGLEQVLDDNIGALDRLLEMLR